MPSHCREAAHFFTCVYLIILGVSSIYLSVGFPCDPWADLIWDKSRGHPIDLLTKKRTCWRDCQAYALRLHLLQNPDLLSNPTVSIVYALVQPTPPNPFCFSNLVPDVSGNPFCDPQRLANLTQSQIQDREARFRKKKREISKLHGIVLGSLCLDCLVVSLSVLLIYISALPKWEPYAFTFLVTLSAHITSLFYSSDVAQWLGCTQEGRKYCDGTEHYASKSGDPRGRLLLPSKSSGVSNFEISIIIKNVNLVCLFVAGLCYYSMRRIGPVVHNPAEVEVVVPEREAIQGGEEAGNDDDSPEGD